jgi:transposase
MLEFWQAVSMDDELLPLNITPEDWAQTPPAVQLALLTLVDLVRDLTAQLQTQRAEINELRARLNQTSQNSSKPPSSDPPSAPPRPTRTPRGKPKGAQLGHSDQQRPLVPPEHIDELVVLYPSACPVCTSSLAPNLPDALPVTRTQVWELPPFRPHITEYQQHTVCCPSCQRLVFRLLPADAPPGAFGPRLTALIGLLHSAYHLSMRQTATFLAEVCDVPISLGSIATSCTRLSEAVIPLDTAIREHIQSQPHLWVDESSWSQGRQRGWLWTAVSEEATSFLIDPSRSQQTLARLIGESYGGVVHSDRASAYHRLPNRQRQLCWAHLMRNLQGLADQQHSESWLAKQMIEQAEQLWTAWHARRCGIYDQVALQQALLPVRLALRDLLASGLGSRWSKLQRFCQDLLTHWEALWSFSRVEGIEPTNNRAEQALRPAVIWRKRCFGTQSAGGSRFVERLLSVITTARQQGREVFGLLVEAVQAAWAGQPAPTLFCYP